MVKDKLLYDLAQTMRDKPLAATALRRLGRVGYASLEEIDRASDWVLLAIPGIGVGCLAELRRLTRPDWKPPSELAVKAVSDFMAAAQLALRLWPVETLIRVIRGSALATPASQPADRRFALDLLSQATGRASYYCPTEELVEALRQIGNGPTGGEQQITVDGGGKAESQKRRQADVLTGAVDRAPHKYNADGNSSHFAFPPGKRQEIVQHYLAACERGEVLNKDSWASEHYGISGRTLLRYERGYERAGAEPR